jgi:hypothetical protein
MDMNIVNEAKSKAIPVTGKKKHMQQNKIKTIYTNYLSYTPDIESLAGRNATGFVYF